MVGTKKQQHFDLIVIGAGAAGMHAALLAAKSNLKVALVENDLLGGSSLHYSDLPLSQLYQSSKRFYETSQNDSFGIRNGLTSFNYPQIIGNIQQVVKKITQNSEQFLQEQKIQTIKGRAYFITPDVLSVNNQRLRAKHFIVATGATWTAPNIPGLADIDYYSPETFWSCNQLPKSVLIMGEHPMGLVLAQQLAIFGTKIHFVTSQKNLLPNFDPEFNDQIEMDLIKNFDINVLANTKIIEITKNQFYKKILVSQNDNQQEILTEEVIIAHKLTPRTDLGLSNAVIKYTNKGIVANPELMTDNRRIYAIGNVLNLSNNPIQAQIEAEIALYNITHSRAKSIDYTTIPVSIELLPKVAKIGLTEADCCQAKINYQSGLTYFDEVPRSIISTKPTGLIKLIANRHSRLIGAEVYGPETDAIIHELALAVKYQLTLNQLLELPHLFLSWQEIINITINKML